MAKWKIKAYHLPGDTCPIQDWYRKQDVRVRAEFDAVLTTLQGTDDWLDTRYEFQPMEREHVGLGEIRFSLDVNTPFVRRFRPVGIWPPLIPQEFILLMGCEKKSNGILIPADAFTLALAYKRQWDEGKGEIYDYI